MIGRMTGSEALAKVLAIVLILLSLLSGSVLFVGLGIGRHYHPDQSLFWWFILLIPLASAFLGVVRFGWGTISFRWGVVALCLGAPLFFGGVFMCLYDRPDRIFYIWPTLMSGCVTILSVEALRAKFRR